MNQDPTPPSLADRPYSRLGIDLVFEIPLALLSLIWFKLVKLIIAVIYGVSLALNRKLLTQWQVFSDKTLQIPIVLPVVMTKGPRWNPHAVVVSVGPFRVENEFSIDLNALRRSAQSWTIVVYRYPSYQTVSHISALDGLTPNDSNPDRSGPLPTDCDGADCEWYDLACDSGLYCLGLRLFEAGNTLYLPEVKIDGQTGVPAKQTPCETPSYHSLNKYHNWFYLSLHHYVFTLLRLRPWLPESFIRQEYLPVGNPDTTFFYDYLRQGDLLHIQVSPLLSESYYMYVTTYGRASMPLNYQTLREQTHTLAPMVRDGFYLIRVRPKHKQVASINQTDLKLMIQRKEPTDIAQ